MDENELYTACLKHAGDLLKAAKKLHEEEKLHNIAFHLATACLEEIGKADLLINIFDPLFDDDRFLNKHKYILDHVKKLWWALWKPYLGNVKISWNEIVEIKGYANYIHKTRMKALYFDVDETGYEIPSEVVCEKEAANLIRLTESRYELATSKEIRELSDKDKELLKWFIDATSDEENNNIIFSDNSMNKLVEIGRVNEWILWLKDEFDKDDKIAFELLQKELSKNEGQQEDQNERKWCIKIRLFSNSHTINPKLLNAWNERIDWISLHSVEKRKNELIIKVTLKKYTLLKYLWDAGWLSAIRFVCSLNIATRGFFWWYIPIHTSRYFDEVNDIESGYNVGFEKRLNLQIHRGNNNLTEQDLINAALCFVGFPNPSNEQEIEPFMKYVNALSHMSKTDIFYRNEETVYHAFYDSLKSGMKYYEKILTYPRF